MEWHDADRDLQGRQQHLGALGDGHLRQGELRQLLVDVQADEEEPRDGGRARQRQDDHLHGWPLVAWTCAQDPREGRVLAALPEAPHREIDAAGWTGERINFGVCSSVFPVMPCN